MKRKKTKKLSSPSTERSCNNKTYSNGFLILTLTILSLLFSNHVSNGDLNFKDDPGNPFYDIFYLYYNEDMNKAKKMLRNLFRNPEYMHLAIINYGLILPYGKKSSDAREYFEKTFKKGERLSIIYLFSLYMNNYNNSYLDLLTVINTRESGLWLEYEKGIYFLNKNNMEIALKHLSRAAEMGFSSIDLLKSERAFKRIRNKKEFNDLLKKIKKNKTISLREKLKREELYYYRNKPSGVSKEIQIALYFEKTRRYDRAERILLSQINSRIPFRDKSIALYSISRIKAKRGDKEMAKKFIKRFINHLSSKEKDNTGYKKLMQYFYGDIIRNDRYLKTVL
jgi:hypothetical protein